MNPRWGFFLYDQLRLILSKNTSHRVCHCVGRGGCGATLSNFGDLIGIGVLGTGVLAAPITVFCMVGVINAMNLSDGLDGLAGGFGAIASLFLVLFAVLQWRRRHANHVENR